MHYSNNDLWLSNMVTNKRHSQQGRNMPKKNGEKNVGPEAARQNTKLQDKGKN